MALIIVLMVTARLCIENGEWREQGDKGSTHTHRRCRDVSESERGGRKEGIGKSVLEEEKTFKIERIEKRERIGECKRIG